MLKLLPRGYDNQAVIKRRKLLNKALNQDVTYNDLVTDNYNGIIENHLDYVKIPMAVAGPALINGMYAKGEFYIPVCTLEGALVISMTRGLYATYLSGGIETIHVHQHLSKCPAFSFDQLSECIEFKNWAEQNFDQFKTIAESTTQYGKLIKIEPIISHNIVILEMFFTTDNAAGQNMVTKAASCVYDYIITNYNNIKIGYIDLNFNGDKKFSIHNLLKGRGHYVIAKAKILRKYCLSLLKISPELLVNICQESSISNMSGNITHNANIANAIAAVYLATGQDIACVGENNFGNTKTSLIGEDLEICVTLPSLTIGTIGGGTNLADQKRSLEMLGCLGKNSAKKLAEIIAAATLGLELSLIASIVANDFTAAHMKYGRQS